MINYSEVKIGDQLQITGEGAPGFAEIGEVVTVIETHNTLVRVENKEGKTATFIEPCGAARLKPYR